MRKVVRRSIALPLEGPTDFEPGRRDITRSNFGPAIGIVVAFTASLVLWSALAHVLNLAVHAVF